MKPKLSIVIPLFNEAPVFAELEQRLRTLLDALPEPAEVVLVDDGSTDTTAELMARLATSDPRFGALFLSRNFGHQIALSAGMHAARGTEAVLLMDADLQDPPELVPAMLRKLREGFDVVYAVRKRRKEGPVLRLAYGAFYRLLKRVADIDIPLDSGDFCLMTRQVVDCLNAMPEESRFLRGMRAWVGFRQTGIAYDREARRAGTTKYSLAKLLRLAANGIFNFSEIPVRLALICGTLSLLIGVGYGIHTLWARFVLHQPPAGFTGLLLSIILFGGTQLLFLGIIGEYVLRIFFQVKQRPLFLVKRAIRDGKSVDAGGLVRPACCGAQSPSDT